MKRRNILAILIAAAMMFTLAMPAMADNFNQHYDEHEDFYHNSGEFNDLPGSHEIPVTASVVGQESVSEVYRIELDWGDMHFEYDLDGSRYDPGLGEYVGDGNPFWRTDNYHSNRVYVMNRSNLKVTATITFAMDANDPFGVGSSVVGNFYDSEDEAKAAALLIPDDTNRTEVVFNLEDASDPAFTVGYWNTEDDWGNPSEQLVGEVYLGLSGTPGTGFEDTPGNTTIGKITVTVAATD